MKHFFRGQRLFVLLGISLAGAVSVYAATTIGTDISTSGSLTVRGNVLAGPDVSSLNPLFAPYIIPGTTIYLTDGNTTQNAFPTLTMLSQANIGMQLVAAGNGTDATEVNTLNVHAILTDGQGGNCGTGGFEGNLGACTYAQAIGTGVHIDGAMTTNVDGIGMESGFFPPTNGASYAHTVGYLETPSGYGSVFNYSFYAQLATNQTAFVAQRHSGQTADLMDLFDSDGTTVLSKFDKNGSLAIGTSTPQGKLDVSAGANATTTVTIGELGLSTSKTCINMNRANGQPGSMYLSAAGVLIVENNYCR